MVEIIEDQNRIDLSETEELLIDVFRAVKKYWRYEVCLVFGFILGVVLI